MRFFGKLPDGSPVTYSGIEEMRTLLRKGLIAKDYAAHREEEDEWKTVGVWLGEDQEDDKTRALAEFAKVDLNRSVVLRPGDVAVRFHTYIGFLVAGVQFEHRAFLPPEDARVLLQRLHRRNLLWGWFFPGLIFVPLLSMANYATQMKSISRQEHEGYVPEWLYSVATGKWCVSFLTKFFIVISLLFCWMPILSLLLAGFGYLGVRKSTSTWRKASIVSLILAAVANIVYFALLALGKFH